MVDELEAELLAWLIGAGFPDDLELTAMQRGLGSAEMWTLHPAPDGARLVVRLFGEGAETDAERERLAMRAAVRHGLPAPAVVTRGEVQRRPFLVTTFIDGEPANQALAAYPEDAHALGVAMGETLGQLHEIVAPTGLPAVADAWIDRGGPALAPIRPLLAAAPRQDRLIHLDYHPANVLVRDGLVSGVIDWENALAGPPPMDLARSRAILRAAVLGNFVPAHLHGAVAQVERGLVAGHQRIHGLDPAPDLSTAWGLAMTVEDLTQQMAKSGGLITPALVDRLTAERDALILVVIEQAARSGGRL